MARNLVVILLCIMVYCSYGQERLLKGRIVADSLEGFAINIVNYTKKTGTTNSKQGYFEIIADMNDSIIFSSVQYQLISYIVIQNDLDNDDFQVTLQPIVTKLDQVYITNSMLSGDIEKDVHLIEIKPYFDNKILGLPVVNRKQFTRQERRIYTASSGPLDVLLNSLNGKLKKLNRLKGLADLDDIVNSAGDAFSTSFFTEDLGLPENLINDFVYYCAQDDFFKNLLKTTEKLTLLEFFQHKAIGYKKFKKIDKKLKSLDK